MYDLSIAEVYAYQNDARIKPQTSSSANLIDQNENSVWTSGYGSTTVQPHATVTYNNMPTKIEVIIRKDSYHHWSHGAKVSVSQNLDGSNALYVNTFGIDSNDVGSRGNVPKIPDHEWEFRRISSATSWTVLDEYDAAIQATSHGSDITALTYESGATFDGSDVYVDVSDWTWGGKMSIETYVKCNDISSKFSVFSFDEGTSKKSTLNFGNDPNAPYVGNTDSTAHLNVFGGNDYHVHKHTTCAGSGAGNENIVKDFF